jgi:hypothetical protein
MEQTWPPFEGLVALWARQKILGQKSAEGNRDIKYGSHQWCGTRLKEFAGDHWPREDVLTVLKRKRNLTLALGERGRPTPERRSVVQRD